MREDMFLRLPGLGLAPAMAAPDMRSRQRDAERDALLRDTIAREQEADRQPCPPDGRMEPVRRPVRAGAA